MYMLIARRIARRVATVVLRLGLPLLAAITALALILGTPTKLKESLSDNNVYGTVVDSAIQNIQKDQSQPGATADQDIPADDVAVEKIAGQVFTPDVLQKSAEQVIDGTYNWLDGDVQQPDFQVDLTGVKTQLAQALGDEAVRRVQALPVCTQQQLRELSQNTPSTFDLPCQPPGLNLQAERDKVVAEALSSDEFLKDPVITADDLKNKQGQTPFQAAEAAPKTFQWMKRLPWLLGAGCIGAAIAVMLLHQERRAGIRLVARMLLVAGIMLLIGYLISVYLFRSIKFDGDATNGTSLQTALIATARDIGAQVNRTLLVFIVAYCGLGIAGLAALHFTKPKNEHKPHVPKSDNEQQSDPPTEEPSNQAAQKDPESPSHPS